MVRPAPSQLHVPPLDGLRGIAVLLVMFSHFAGSMVVLGLNSPGLAPFRIGWCGVDVFFALSGFLITGILLDTKGSPDFFRNFYARRVLRIFPLYYGALLVVMALRLLIPGDPVWGLSGSLAAPGSLLWPIAYLENYAIFLQGPLATGILTHYWSLAVEEHFYLLWPLIVWLGSRRQIAIVAVLAIIGSIALRASVYANGVDVAYVAGLTPLRLDGLAIGAIASLWLRAPVSSRTLSRSAWIALGIAGVALLGSILGRHTLSQFDPVMWTFGYTLVAALSASVILVAMAPGPLRNILSIGVLRWLGKYSFGLYIWHPILAVMLLHSRIALVATGQSTGAIILATGFAFCMTLLVAWLSYQLWEKRFLRLKKYFQPSAIPLDEAAASGVPGGLWRPAATTSQ
jgi:peptidoglycan/LPS O-acetylase OafA/YrhL